MPAASSYLLLVRQKIKISLIASTELFSLHSNYILISRCCETFWSLTSDAALHGAKEVPVLMLMDKHCQLCLLQTVLGLTAKTNPSEPGFTIPNAKPRYCKTVCVKSIKQATWLPKQIQENRFRDWQ